MNFYYSHTYGCPPATLASRIDKIFGEGVFMLAHSCLGQHIEDVGEVGL